MLSYSIQINSRLKSNTQIKEPAAAEAVRASSSADDGNAPNLMAFGQLVGTMKGSGWEAACYRTSSPKEQTQQGHEGCCDYPVQERVRDPRPLCELNSSHKTENYMVKSSEDSKNPL